MLENNKKYNFTDEGWNIKKEDWNEDLLWKYSAFIVRKELNSFDKNKRERHSEVDE